MKFSEALLAGAKLMKPAPYRRAYPDGAGCALGMAEIAKGNGVRQCAAEKTWPELNLPATAPCGHVAYKQGPRCSADGGAYVNLSIVNRMQAIVHLFNEHVFGAQDWTIEGIADWYRSLEEAPKDEGVLAKP